MNAAGALRMLVCVVVPLFWAADGVSGQRPPAAGDWRMVPNVGIGYKGNMPRALIGGSAHVTLPQWGGVGLYVDFRTTHESFRDEEFRSNITVRQAELEFGDDFVQERNHWRVANIALVRPITGEFALYAGGGLARHTVYREYFDPGLERGEFGHYRVEDDDDSGNRINFTAGAMFRAGRRIAYHFGGETAPAGFTVGVSLMLPVP